MEKPPSLRTNYRRAYRRLWDKRIRLEAIAHYGGKCFCCGEGRPEFLGFDHIEGGGNKHRDQMRTGAGGAGKCGTFHYWLKKNGWPLGIRIACHNCNLARGFYGYCPHETEKQFHVISLPAISGGVHDSVDH